MASGSKRDGHVPDGDAMPTHETARDILRLTRSGEDAFTATHGAVNHIGTIYGGRLLGQALRAACATVTELPVTSLHAYFLAPGDVGAKIEYRVQRIRDSRRFANRQVSAYQGERLIFTMLSEFHTPEAGFSHQQVAMPDVPPPEEVAPLQHFVHAHEADIDLSAVRNFSGAMPIELRPVAPERYFMERSHMPRSFWLRLRSAAGIEDPRDHQCLLAYATDYWLAGVSAIPHVFPTNGDRLLIASLDHSIWFHRPLCLDDWLLHDTTSAFAGDGLAIAQGRIFDRNGVLVASTTQECLLRPLGETVR